MIDWIAFYGVSAITALSVKLMLLLKHLILYSGAWFRQTKYIVMMTKEGSTKIVNYITPEATFFRKGVAI